MIRLPQNLTLLELQRLVRDINDQLNKVVGVNNADFKGRRITNAGSAQDPADYVTLRDVGSVFDKKLAEYKAQLARKSAQQASIGIGSGGSGSGSGGGSFPGGPPTVDLYDGSGIVSAYALANPAQLADSCQPPDGTGTWDFMDGVVAALRAADDRFGYNGKRGDVSDLSHDAVSYYYGDYAVMAYGSQAVYVIDVIGGHCGSNPTAAWNDVTGSGGANGAWVPNR